MILEGLFLLLIIVGICILVYRGAIHEYQILQKEYDPEQDWSTPLSEQLPLVMRGLPKHLLGSWTLPKTENRQWAVYVRKNKQKLRTTWAEWLKQPALVPENLADLAIAARLDRTIEDWSTEGIRRWSWIPPAAPTPYVLSAAAGMWLGARKTVAEFTALVATDQDPIELWIAHEGAIPARDAAELVGKNPWDETTETLPWIADVKFIEIKLRPGNAVLIPKHWWYAVRPTGISWFWTADFHTPVSRLVAAVKK